MKKFLISLLFVIFAQVTFAAEKLNVQDSSNASIQDPFSRGLVRSPKYGSINSDGLSEFSRNDDLRSLSDIRYYRILGLFVAQADLNNNFISDLRSSKPGINPNGYYISLGSYRSLNLSKQYALDFLSSQASFVNRIVSQHTVNKNKRMNYQLQYGPFTSLELAKSSCLFLKLNSKQIDLDCETIIKRPMADKEKSLPMNSASIGLSQAALVEYAQSAMNYDLNSIAEASVLVKEGERLGPQGFYIVRINHLGIYLASESGDKALVPPSTLPINLNIKIDVPSKQTPKIDTGKPQEAVNSNKPTSSPQDIKKP
jgi:hypothetical protein